MLYTSPWSRFEHTTSVVVGTDCIGCCKSNYHATTVTTNPVTDDHIYCQFVVVATLPFFLLSWLNTRLLTTVATSGTGNSATNKFGLDFLLIPCCANCFYYCYTFHSKCRVFNNKHNLLVQCCDIRHDFCVKTWLGCTLLAFAFRVYFICMYYLMLLSNTMSRGPSWSWSHGWWIYNHLYNQCLSPLKLWVRIPLMATWTRYNIL
jgi:hypothetical protein